MASAHHATDRTDHARPVLRLEASGSSPDEAMATLPGQYGGRHWHSAATDLPYAFHYTAVGDDCLTLRRSQVQGSIRGEVHIGGDYVVHWLTSGSIVLDTLGDPVPVPLMRPSVSPEGEEFVFEAVDFDARLVHVSRGLVHDVAGERNGGVVHALQQDVRRPPDAAALLRWRDAMAGATAVLAGRDAAPLAWHRATRAVAAAFLELWPPQGDPAHPALLYPRNARLRTAVEYVHAHIAEPVTVGQIAEACGLSIRSTQESFQRVLGVSPMRYVQDLRMQRVRADLTDTDPASSDVATVARRWGFFHVGRFSGAYRERFGEYPKETLRR